MTLYKAVASGTYNSSEEWSFSLHFNSTNDLATTHGRWHTALVALWTGELDANISDQVVLTEYATASLTLATGKQISRLLDVVSLPGASATESLPAQCAPAVSTRSATATRAGRGRFYLPPFRVGIMDGGRISAAAMTVCGTALTAMFASLAGGTPLDPVLYSRTAFATTNITAADMGDVIDTQRRRRNKLIEARTAIVV
uniref:Uncharacterized protein n=1 Tax=uncultured prokaryote TaxID=198431 RepID=A0A0H5QN32_9ZZZZ|nr:hypothetical protein [uncultured prokaryote]